MSKNTLSKVMIEFLKGLRSITPIAKEVIGALKQPTIEQIENCVEIPPKDSHYAYALNCKKLYYKYLKPKIKNKL